MIFDIILNDKASLVGKLIILPSYIEAFQDTETSWRIIRSEKSTFPVCRHIRKGPVNPCISTGSSVLTRTKTCYNH